MIFFAAHSTNYFFETSSSDVINPFHKAPTNFAKGRSLPQGARLRGAGCGRSEEGQYGRTVEAIEQPIAAPASSPVSEPARTRFVRDVRSRTYGNPSSSCSPGLSTQGLGSSHVFSTPDGSILEKKNLYQRQGGGATGGTCI